MRKDKPKQDKKPLSEEEKAAMDKKIADKIAKLKGKKIVYK